MKFPITANLDDSLRVDVHLHSFFLGDRERQCWTYLTHGLKQLGQREMALSLLLDDDADPEQFPKTPIKMFQLLADHAKDARLVDSGDGTLLGQRGIFEFPCLFYVPAIQYEELPCLDEYLGLILVHQEEYDYAKQYGLTRFLSRLGRFCSTFPYPTWNTQIRPSLFPTNTREVSMLADAGHVLLEHSHVHQQADVLQFQLNQKDADSVGATLQTLSIDQVAIFNTALSPRCDASLYWQGGQESPGAYAGPAATTGMISGSFLSIGYGEAQEMSLVEDGFSVTLLQTDWQALCDAISVGQSFERRLPDGQRFLLDYLDVYAKLTARRYESAAIWRQLDAPETLEVTKPSKLLTMHPFVNLSGENSLAQRVNRQQLEAYIERIEQTLSIALSEEQDQFEFEVLLTIYPNKIDCQLSASIDLNPEFIEFMRTTILEIEFCTVTSQIKFKLPFVVNQE